MLQCSGAPPRALEHDGRLFLLVRRGDGLQIAEELQHVRHRPLRDVRAHIVVVVLSSPRRIDLLPLAAQQRPPAIAGQSAPPCTLDNQSRLMQLQVPSLRLTGDEDKGTKRKEGFHGSSVCNYDPQKLTCSGSFCKPEDPRPASTFASAAGELMRQGLRSQAQLAIFIISESSRASGHLWTAS
eukprot:scaffold1070_cov245-Pinguiococcus_pyrenoidosus.AAC.30